MNTIIERFTEAIKDILIGLIKSSLDNMFTSVNEQVLSLIHILFGNNMETVCRLGGFLRQLLIIGQVIMHVWIHAWKV